MSKKTLVIVESPSKAKTINKYLGKDYIVHASVGHIKDLESFRLGVDIKNDFAPKYVTVRGKNDLIKKLKELSKDAEEVLIATDPDREGEAIAWHIAEEVKKQNDKIQRVLFNEITKTGIQKGLKEPREIDTKLFMSQQARRVMDRLIGYQVSPFVSRAMLSKTSKALSAGRVQSVALRLICEREEEIRNFAPIQYWSILADFNTESQQTLKAKLVAFENPNGKNNTIKNPEGSGAGKDEEETKKIQDNLSTLHYIKSLEQTTDLIARIKKETYNIDDITKKEIKRNPSAPFTTSSLQQEASKKLGFSNKKTMQVAQRLYEGVTLGEEGEVGLITYMRTDSFRIAPEAITAVREYIADTYGDKYLPAKENFYAQKKANVQDAHEAIRPANMLHKPSAVKSHLDRDEYKLYELIFNRFVASQTAQAVIEQTTINIKGGEFLFRTTGSVIVFDGFMAVYSEGKDENDEKEDDIIPAGLLKQQPVTLKRTTKQESQTKPKPRYNQASLVKELDENGIGRPSTYANIVTTLQDRKYVDLDKKVFMPTELGMDVNSVLLKNFPELFSVDFTADMEKELDIIADGNMTYLEAMKIFYGPFSKSLKVAESSEMPEIPCEVCGAPMVIKVSRRGRFLGCSKYPECTNTKPLPSDKKKEEPQIAEGVTCDLCGKPMYIRDSKYGKFYGCTDYPTCKGTKPIVSNVTCPKCGKGKLAEKYSPKSRKKFWGCSEYPSCDYLTNYEPLNEKCPKCGNYYIEMRFKKVDGEWAKYKTCPACKEKFE